MTYKLNIRRVTLGLLPIIALVFGGALAATSQTSAPRNVKNVVLIHGGFVDGSGWEGVYKTSRMASPRDEARCTERRVYDHASRLEEGGSLD